MKKLLYLVVLLIMPIAGWSQSPTAIITGTALGIGQTLTLPVTLQVQLVGCGQDVPHVIPSGSIITNNYSVTAAPSTFVATAPVYGNDIIVCGGQSYSTYAVTWNVNSRPAAPTKMYRVVQGQTCNISDGTCPSIGFTPPLIQNGAASICSGNTVLSGFTSTFAPICNPITGSPINFSTVTAALGFTPLAVGAAAGGDLGGTYPNPTITNQVKFVPTVNQNILQPAGTSLGINIFNKTYYADLFCTTFGVYDQTCLANAITAAGNNSRIILSPRTYTFASRVNASSLVNVWIEGYGAVIKNDGGAYRCTSCIGGGIKGINFSPVTSPTLFTCTLNQTALSMSCAGLPTGNANIVLDPWATGVGHMPTSDDAAMLPGGNLTSPQQHQVWDTGVSFVNSNGLTVSDLTGSYTHIVLVDSSNFIVSNNSINGGNGNGELLNLGISTGGDRCGAICLWSASATAGQFTNLHNKILNNTIQYAASRSIAIIHSDDTVIQGNQMLYAGEGGVITGEGNGFYSQHTSIIGNTARNSLYDGFVLDSDFPSSSIYVADSIMTNNVSSFNFRVGFYGDGKYNTVANNHADHNGLGGYVLNFAFSKITDNTSYNNNLANIAGNGQFMISVSNSAGGSGYGNNSITNNFALTDVTLSNSSGIAIINAPGNPLEEFSGNRVIGGLTISVNASCPTCGPITQLNNYDQVTGLQPATVSATGNIVGTSTSSTTGFYAGNAGGGGWNSWVDQFGATDAKVTTCMENPTNFQCAFVNDALNASVPFLTINRTGTTITSVSIANTPTIGTPTVGNAACIKAAGPPVVIGFCTGAYTAGVCACN